MTLTVDIMMPQAHRAAEMAIRAATDALVTEDQEECWEALREALQTALDEHGWDVTYRGGQYVNRITGTHPAGGELNIEVHGLALRMVTGWKPVRRPRTHTAETTILLRSRIALCLDPIRAQL